jgi:hypothetical protein
MASGDRAVLYVTQGAHHNPTRDVSRLAGLATVRSTPTLQEPVEIGGRTFDRFCPVQFDTPIDERTGPAVSGLVGQLELIGNRNAWGQYFRRSPVMIGKHDFDVFVEALRQAEFRS